VDLRKRTDASLNVMLFCGAGICFDFYLLKVYPECMTTTVRMHFGGLKASLRIVSSSIWPLFARFFRWSSFWRLKNSNIFHDTYVSTNQIMRYGVLVAAVLFFSVLRRRRVLF